MGSSPISVPTGSPGAQAGAMAKVRQAIEILNSALSQFPAGSEVWKALNDAITKVTKQIPPSDAALGVNNTALRDLQQNASKNAMMQMLQQAQGAGGASGGGGAASPLAAPPNQ